MTGSVVNWVCLQNYFSCSFLQLQLFFYTWQINWKLLVNFYYYIAFRRNSPPGTSSHDHICIYIFHRISCIRPETCVAEKKRTALDTTNWSVIRKICVEVSEWKKKKNLEARPQMNKPWKRERTAATRDDWATHKS